MASSKSYIPIKEKYDRIIVLIDMDCFYCQVEEMLDESLRGKPIAVVQYVENAGIIAVNYKARAMGVTRHMREKEAKAVCSDLICVKVPSKYNKADISKYKDAGKRVADVFEKFTRNLERASVDEAYLDITENVAARLLEMRQKKFSLQPQHLLNTYAIGYENIGAFIRDVSAAVDVNCESTDYETKSLQSSKLRLLLGASIVSDIRQAVKDETGYTCSAGIAHNKILAKLVCGMNKPNKQTLLPIDSVPSLFSTLEISKIKGMGGKVGEEVCRKLDAKVMNDLLKYEEGELSQHFGQRIGNFLYLIARGIDLEKVERKVINKCIAVSKNFRGKNEIINVNSLKFWLKELSKELKERLDRDHEENHRVARQMTVQFTQHFDNRDVSSSRTVQLNGQTVNSLSLDEIVQEVFNTIERHTSKLLRIEGKCILNNNIKHLGIGVAKLEEINSGGTSSNPIQNLLKKYTKKPSTVENSRVHSNEFVTNASAIKSKDAVSREAEGTSKGEEEEEENKENEIKPQCSEEDIFDGVANEPSEPEMSFTVRNQFHGDTSIKGVNTLKHWLSHTLHTLITNVREKCSKDHLAPRQIKLLWQQSGGDSGNGGRKDFCEIIPLDIFTKSSIKVEFFINVMSDSGSQFDTTTDGEIANPISLIEMKAIDFETRHAGWNLTIEDFAENTLVEEEDCERYNIANEEESDIPIYEASAMEAEFEESDDYEKMEMTDVPINLGKQETKHVSGDESGQNIEDVETEYLELSGNNAKSPQIHNNEKSWQRERIEETTSSKKETSEMSRAGSSSGGVQSIKVKSEEELGVPHPAYMQTYAEFQQNPIVDALNPLEECLECGKMIRKLDMLTHLDGHIAMLIANSQREEYRAEQKRKILSQSSQKSVKQTPKSKTPSVTRVTSIEKFITKPSQGEAIPENQEMCLQCSKLVLKDEMPLHMDHHFAQLLRMEQLKPSNAKNVPGSKRKRPLSTNDNHRAKSLKSYFTE